MNRRSAIKAAIAAVAGVCGWKAAKAVEPVLGLRLSESVACKPFVIRPGKAPADGSASFIVEIEHGSFECTVTTSSTTWRAV